MSGEEERRRGRGRGGGRGQETRRGDEEVEGEDAVRENSSTKTDGARPQTSDVVICPIRGPQTSRQLPWDRFSVLSRFLPVPGPLEGPPMAESYERPPP